MNTNIALTLILLALMAAAGTVSAAYGFAIGREALRGITQPDVRPINKVSGRKKNSPPQSAEVLFLKEENILKNVKTQIEGDKPDLSDKGDRPVSVAAVSNPPQNQTPPKPEENSNQVSLPVSSSDRGVILEVSSSHQESDDLVLDVKLRNDGEKPVKFLYSFLNVTDDQGRVLSASAEGLPAELPARSQFFSGKVSISTGSLKSTSKLSLSLTDYPDQ